MDIFDWAMVLIVVQVVLALSIAFLNRVAFIVPFLSYPIAKIGGNLAAVLSSNPSLARTKVSIAVDSISIGIILLIGVLEIYRRSKLKAVKGK